MIIELRTYTARPGRRDDWVRFMHEVVVPFQTSQGMEILGLFTDESDDDVFVWMRRFSDELQMATLRDLVYDSTVWREEIAPRVSEFLVPGSAVIRILRPAGDAGFLSLPTSKGQP